MRRRTALACLGLLLSGACSDDDGGAASRSGVEASKLLSALSAPELDAVCRWLAEEEYEGLTAKVECLPITVYRSDTTEVCVAEDAACRADHPARREERRSSMLANCEEYVLEAECVATVAQFEACVRDMFRLGRELADSLSCDRPMPGQGATDAQIDPKSCDVVPRGCFP